VELHPLQTFGSRFGSIRVTFPQSAQRNSLSLPPYKRKACRVFLRGRLSTIDLQHEFLRLGSVAWVVQILTSSGWPLQVSVTIVPAVDGKTTVIAGEFSACGHEGDQEGWVLGGNPDLQVATRSIWFRRSHPDLSYRHKTALNEIENHMTSLI
jgi:hypothetical protein